MKTKITILILAVSLLFSLAFRHRTANEPMRYVANLSQWQDGVPVATVLENTLGGDLVWTRVNAGVYRGTRTGAFPDAMRTVWPNTVTVFDSGVVQGTINVQWVDENTIQIVTHDSGGSDTADGILEYYAPFRLELKVYPSP